MNYNQLRAILWLRLRLTHNQWNRGDGVGPVLAALMTLGALGAGGASFLGGVFGGLVGLKHAAPEVHLFVWLGVGVGFLFFWTIGLLTQLQRSESIDLPRLLHLPVRLEQIFLINYVASLAQLPVAIFAPGIVGLTLGATLSLGPSMLLMLPLGFAVIFSVSAWTYCFQGWLATQISNPRKRRALVMGFTLLVVLAVQAPNLLFASHHRPRERPGAARVDDPEEDARLLAAAQMAAKFPPLWIGAGAESLSRGQPLPALLATLGLALIGALGLRRGYRNTLAYYRGSSDERAAKQSSESTSASKPAALVESKGTRLVERQLPFVSAQTSAVAFATLRSMLRAPEVAMGMGSGILVAGGMCLLFSLRFEAEHGLSILARPLYLFGTMLLSMMILAQFIINQFGFDRDALRTLLLAPLPRERLLLGKNLATALLISLPVAVILVVAGVFLHLDPLLLLAGVCQLFGVSCVCLAVGNVLSILVPYRIRPGSLKAASMPALAVAIVLGWTMLLPVITSPMALGAVTPLAFHFLGWRFGDPAALLVSLLAALAMLFLYRLTLRPLGALLRKRETVILAAVTVENE